MGSPRSFVSWARRLASSLNFSTAFGAFLSSCAAVRNARKELVPSSSMVFQLSQTEDETAFNGCSGGGRAVPGGARAPVYQ